MGAGRVRATFESNRSVHQLQCIPCRARNKSNVYVVDTHTSTACKGSDKNSLCATVIVFSGLFLIDRFLHPKLVLPFHSLLMRHRYSPFTCCCAALSMGGTERMGAYLLTYFTQSQPVAPPIVGDFGLGGPDGG